MPKQVSLPEAMSMAFSGLCQVQQVLDREWDELRAEQQCLMYWGSLLKMWILAAQQQAPRKRAHLDATKEVLREEQVTIGKLDQRTWELLEEAREAHAAANTHAKATTKV
jgi:hypothetical protein